jgi:hypothetical protein
MFDASVWTASKKGLKATLEVLDYHQSWLRGAKTALLGLSKEFRYRLNRLRKKLNLCSGNKLLTKRDLIV